MWLLVVCLVGVDSVADDGEVSVKSDARVVYSTGTCGWRIANRPHDPGRYHVL